MRTNWLVLKDMPRPLACAWQGRCTAVVLLLSVLHPILKPFDPRACLWQGRCAAVALLQNVLAVLPAVETDVLEAQLAAGGARAPAGGLPATVASSYLIQLGKLGIREARPAVVRGRACAWRDA